MRRVTALLLPLLFCGCGRASIFLPVGPIANANRIILLNSLTIMLAIGLPTIIAALAFVWWFRAGNAKATRIFGAHRADRLLEPESSNP